MSKRGADEYITKEHGSTPNKSEENKGKMSTAAQIAKRKMAAPKSRLNRAPAGTSTPPSNPFGGSSFGSAQPQSQQTFGNLGNGVTFGQSQSFPPSDSTTSAGFNFSVPAQSSSFTFGQSIQNNPFATQNGSAAQEENKTTEDTVMESPQKKPAFGAGMFGASQNSGPVGSGASLFGGFGQSTTSAQQQSSLSTQSTSLFGQPQTAINGLGNGAPSSIFGSLQNQPTDKPLTQPSSLFGQNTNESTASAGSSTTNGLFGQSTTQTPSFSLGKTAAEAPASQFSFGTSQSKATPAEPTKAPSFSFGPPAQTDSTPATPKFSFGQPSAQSTSAPSPSKFSFGQPASQSPAKSFVAPTETPLTGSLSASPQNSALLNTFGSLNNPKSTEAASSAGSPSKIMDSPATTAAAEKPSLPSATPANPFAGLFGQSSTTSAAASSDSTKPVFNFAAPAQPQAGFGAPKSEESVLAPGPNTTSPSKPPTTSNFSNTPKQPSVFSSGTSSATPTSNLFGSVGGGASILSSSGRDEKSTTKSTPTFSFGQTPASTPFQPAASTSTGGFVFGSSASASTSALTAAAAVTSNSPSMAFGSKTESASSPSTLFGTAKAATASTESSLPSTSTAQPAGPGESLPSNARLGATDDPKYTIFSNAPARIPPYLSAEKYKSYDSSYRLHSLNREFQKRVATLNPIHEDFENIVRVYVAARESIGESIGLYTRNVAGMKRKGDHLDDEDNSGSAKKSKSASTSASGATPLKSDFASSIFQPVPSSTISTGNKAIFGTNATTSPGKTLPASQSGSPTLFKNLIPEQPVQSNSAAANTFAPSNSTSSLIGTAGSGFKPVMPSSTTPPSSPPKKTAPKVPTFGAGPGSDFMSAFKKQSEASAAKFEKEAMEKRKAEDFDSDEDDEEAWTKKYEEEQRAKKTNVAGFKGFTPSFAGTNSSPATATHSNSIRDTPVSLQTTDKNNSNDDPDSEEDAENDDAVDDEDDADDEAHTEEPDAQDDEEASDDSQSLQANGKSLFDRISRASQSREDQTPRTDAFSAAPKNTSLFGNFKATPEAPSFSPITPSSSVPYKPSKTFNFTPTPRDSPTPTPGASVFEGGTTRDGPIPGEGLFGSRSSTPVNGETSHSNIFGSLSNSQNHSGEDHTWKKGSAIKFGTDPSAPEVSITAPSPLKEAPKFGALFGMTESSSNGVSGSNTLGFGFGTSNSTPAPGFLGAVSYLAPGSGTTSGISSRATSPGATDNESVATNESEDAQADPQSTLLSHSGPYPGEENETIVFEARAKILRSYKEAEIEGTKKQKGWNVEGIGPMRVLKNKESGKTRIVARAEPNANVVFNANLTAGVTYKATGSTIIVPVFSGGSPVQWMVKVKTAAIASELAEVLEKNNKP